MSEARGKSAQSDSSAASFAGSYAGIRTGTAATGEMCGRAHISAACRFAWRLRASANAPLKRDEAGDWLILGKRGRIYATPEGYQLVYFSRPAVTEADGDGPHVEDWLHAKRKLIFCRLAQDGTGEAIFFLDRLPTEDEAEVIPDIMGIKRRVRFSEEAIAASRERAVARGWGAKSPRSGGIDPQDAPVG